MATLPIATPTIAVVDKAGESLLFCALDSPVAVVLPIAVAAAVRLELESGLARTVTVAALPAKLAMDMEISAGSG